MAAEGLLQVGDMVVFVSSDGMVLCPRRRKGKGDTWEFVPDSTFPSSFLSAAHSDAILTVMKDGHFFGFRSVLANGKVLQASKVRGVHLRFENHNFGPWEKWLLSGDSLSNCELTNRKWGDKRFSVTIKKVNAFHETEHFGVEKTISEFIHPRAPSSASDTTELPPLADLKEDLKQLEYLQKTLGHLQEEVKDRLGKMVAMDGRGEPRELETAIEKEIWEQVKGQVAEGEGASKDEISLQGPLGKAVRLLAGQLAMAAVVLKEEGRMAVELEGVVESMVRKYSNGGWEWARTGEEYGHEMEEKIAKIKEEMKKEAAEAKLMVESACRAEAERKMETLKAEMERIADKRVAVLKREGEKRVMEREREVRKEMESAMKTAIEELTAEHELNLEEANQSIWAEAQSEAAGKLAKLKAEMEAKVEEVVKERMARVEAVAERRVSSIRLELMSQFGKLTAETIGNAKAEIEKAADAKVSAIEMASEEKLKLELEQRLAEMKVDIMKKAQEELEKKLKDMEVLEEKKMNAVKERWAKVKSLLAESKNRQLMEKVKELEEEVVVKEAGEEEFVLSRMVTLWR